VTGKKSSKAYVPLRIEVRMTDQDPWKEETVTMIEKGKFSPGQLVVEASGGVKTTLNVAKRDDDNMWEWNQLRINGQVWVWDAGNSRTNNSGVACDGLYVMSP
jgi:hypothetical protein